MTQPENTDQSARTFEVVISSSAPDQLLALRGLANAYGWPVSEKTEPDRPAWDAPTIGSTPLVQSNFEEISGDMWGDTQYGRFAYSYIDSVRDSAGIASVEASRGVVRFRSTGNTYGQPKQFVSVELGSADVMSPLDVLEKAQGIIEAGQFPFKINLRAATEGEQYIRDVRKLLAVEPLDCNVSSLKEYVKSRGMGGHRFHGAIGKAIDTLLVAAGEDPVVMDQPDPKEFISLDDFASAMELAQVYGGQMVTTRRNLLFDAMHQFILGGYAPTGELIVEGECSVYRSDDRLWMVEKVALSSLVSFVPRTRNQNSNVGVALGHIRELYEKWQGDAPSDSSPWPRRSH